MNCTIGIDLGTTYSGVAIFRDELPQMIPNESGAVMIPSLVAFNRNQILVGDDARYQMGHNPKNSIYEVKRLMGKSFNDESVQKDKIMWPFDLIDDGNAIKVKVTFDKKDILLTPEEISAKILYRLKQSGEEYLKTPVKDVVITVPAHFNNNQKSATKDAGAIAGLNVLKIINEPTAAALAYGFGRREEDKDETLKKVLVYDLGGGTFDVSILNICGREFRVLSITGDSHLGGEDFTNRMVTHLFQKFEEKHHGVKLTMDSFVRNRLRIACETAKRQFSAIDCKVAKIELDKFYIMPDGNRVDYYTEISRDVFESINQDLFQKSIDLVNQCISDANLTASDIDEVLLVGGSIRITKIQEMLELLFSPERVNKSVDPDTAVAMGAAIEAAKLSGNCCETVRNITLYDVIPLSLGVGSSKDFEMMSFMLKKNSIIPSKLTERFYTRHDNQTSVRFPIYEGEREFTKDNFYLGEFLINGLPKGPAGSVGFDVTFDIDLNGILKVTAMETSTGKSGGITLEDKLKRRTDEQVQEMIIAAEQWEEIDRVNKKKLTKLRDLERYTFDVSNYLTLESTQDKISARIYNTCRTKNDDISLMLSNCENPSELDLENWLKDLKSACLALKELFKVDKGRDIGEYASIKDESCSTIHNGPKTLYDVE